MRPPPCWPQPASPARPARRSRSRRWRWASGRPRAAGGGGRRGRRSGRRCIQDATSSGSAARPSCRARTTCCPAGWRWGTSGATTGTSARDGFTGAVPRPRAPTHGPRLPPLQFAVLRPVPPRLTACVGAPPDLACTHGAPRAGRGDLGNSLVSPLSCMPRCRPQTAHGARPWFVGRSEMARSPGQRLGFSY